MADTANIGKLVVDLLLKDEQFQKGMKDALGTTQNSMPKVQQVATKAMSAVTTAFKAATAAVVGFGAASTAVGAQFEQQMAMVGALKGLNQADTQFQALQAQARKLGSTTEFTATQAAEALEELARAGATVEESIASSESALVLAGTSAAGLAESTQLLVATQRQFGLEASESKRITDVFSAAMRGSLLDFASVREAMKFAGTAGASFGMTLEQTTASIAAFRDLGLEGSLAGTNFRMAMIAAAQGTEKQRVVLEKYGLALADINPETNSFIDIVEKMGEVGLTASDAVAIFGSRAGANIAQLAAQTRLGAVDMRKFAGELEKSSEAGKDAASMYETIGQTVAFATKISISALQDLMIEVFQTYAEPLRKLIETLPEVLNTVTQAVKAQGPVLRSQFAQTLGAIGDFLKNNAQGLADAFVNTMQVLAALGPVLSTTAQILIVIARNADAVMVALTGAMMVGTAVKFALAIKGIAAAFGLGTTAVTMFGGALTVSTGGLFAVVAAVGLAVTALSHLIAKLVIARNRTEDLREAEEQLAKRTEALAKAEEDRLGAVLDDQQDRIRERLTTDKELDDSTRRRLESTLRLTAAEAAQAVAEGRLIELDGELVDARQAVAEGNEDAADMALTLADATQAQADALGKQTRAAEKALKNLEGQKLEAVKNAKVRTAAIALGLKESATYGEVAAKLKELNAVRAQEASKAETLRNRVAQGVADAVASEVKVEFDAQREIANTKAQTADDTTDKREAATKKIEDLMARLVQANAKAAGDEVAARHTAYRKDLVNIEAAFGERLALEQKGSEAYKQIDAQRVEARKLAEQASINDITEIRRKEREAAQAEAKQLADQVARFTQTAASEAVQLERDKQAALTDLAEQGASDRQLAEVAAAFDARVNEVRFQAESRANDLLLALRGKGLSQREQLEREKAAALLELTLDASAETRAAIEKAFDKAIQKAPKTLKEQVDALRKGFKRAAQAAKDLAEKLGLVKERAEDQPEKEIGKLGKAWQSVKQSVGKVLGPVGDVLGKVGKALGKVGKTYGDIGKAAFAFGKAATGAAMDAMGAISGLLNKLSGFQFSLTDVIGGALDAQNEALDAQAEIVQQVADAEAALAEAQASGDTAGAAEAQQALAEAEEALRQSEESLAEGMPSFAADFVQALVQDAAQFAIALAEGAGPALATLGEQIPVLMDAVIAAIPQVVQALVDNIPTIIFGIVDALPDLIVVLVQGLTEVLLTLFEQLPALLTALLTDVLPTLITEVAAALPVILQGLIDALPAIIQAVIDAIPVVVRAIVQALPDIITAVVGLLPEIIGLLIGALPMIAVALLDAILFELVPALPGIVAKFFKELVKGMGNAIKAIAEGIGQAIADFFNIFKKKDKNKGKTGAFSGISYVPATMRMTLHKGEAVIPADRNAQGMPGETAPAPAGAAQNGMGSGGQAGAPIDIAIMAEGRLLDAVQVQAMKRGGAVGIQNEIRRSSGVRVGLDRGRFTPWSR